MERYAGLVDIAGMETPAVSLTVSGPQQAEIARLVLAAYGNGLNDEYRAKRRWPRYHQATPLEVKHSGEEDSRAHGVTMHTISGGGVSFISRDKYDPDDAIRIREWTPQGNMLWLTGHVVYCAEGLGGYLIGFAWDEPLSEAECRQVEQTVAAAAISAPAERSAGGVGYALMGAAAIVGLLWVLVEMPN